MGYVVMTEREALREIRKMIRDHKIEVTRTALVIKSYALLIWMINHSRKL
jgi:hypothetical protein